MSATELKDRLLRIFDKQIEDKAYIALSAQWLAPRPGGQHGVIPATTPADIAMNVLEANAFRRGVEAAKNALIEEHKKLVAPDSPPAEKSEEEDDDEPRY